MTLPFGLLPPVEPSPSGLEHATNHKERAIGALIGQFNTKARFTKLVEILTRPFQELEDTFWDLYTKRRLDTATGVQLDLIGKVLLEQRRGLGDDDYRAILRIKAKVLFSRGTGPNLIQICQLFLQNDDFTYEEFYPATVVITLLGASALAVSTLRRFLKRAKSAGVRMDLVDGSGGLGVRFHYGSEGTGVGYGVGTYGSLI